MNDSDSKLVLLGCRMIGFLFLLLAVVFCVAVVTYHRAAALDDRELKLLLSLALLAIAVGVGLIRNAPWAIVPGFLALSAMAIWLLGHASRILYIDPHSITFQLTNLVMAVFWGLLAWVLAKSWLLLRTRHPRA